MVSYGMVRYSTVLYGIIGYGKVRYSRVGPGAAEATAQSYCGHPSSGVWGEVQKEHHAPLEVQGAPRAAKVLLLHP